MTTTVQRVEIDGGGYAVALIDDETGAAEITSYDRDGHPVQRTYGRFQLAATCPACGSHRTHVEERDAGAVRQGVAPPRDSYGPWLVCDECQHERLLPITD